MSPDDYIAIDETLYPTRGGISFKTYNKDKPAKYLLNFRSLGSSRRSYIYYTVPYARKPVEVTESHKKDTLTSVKQFVKSYEIHGYLLKGTFPQITITRPLLYLNGYTRKILLAQVR